LMPASSPALSSGQLTLKPRRPARRVYMHAALSHALQFLPPVEEETARTL
jgi:hypothetical protein